MLQKSAVRILALDDEPFMLKLLSHMLTGMGFSSVILCDNGLSALDQIKGEGNHPNLILLDLNMPGMDGIEFVRHLVEINYTGSLILISGEDERMLQTAEKLVQAHKIHVLGHLHKPVKKEVLSELMERWTPTTQVYPPIIKKLYTGDELRAAIDNAQLVNYYQPKVSVASGEVIGVETLVRWQHPVDGLVLPDHFISVAETHGLINDLTRMVLTQALNQAKDWQQAGLTLRVAVNISMDNLASLDFVEFVSDLTARSGVPPQRVVLEVTESRLMKDTRAPLEILTRLRLKRFRLSIDDFGTGHSSLAQLRDIPFDELKIDQGFVHHASTNETLRAMYETSLSLARQLGMEVVAEGVEDRSDWDLLKSTGCDLAQGFFISKAMPAEDFPGWLEKWKERVSHEL